MLKINGKITKINFKKILNYILKNHSTKKTIIEIFGVDGAGKSFLTLLIRKELLKKQEKKVKIIHLWKFEKNKQIIKNTIPYTKSKYIYPVSLVKEIYLIIRMIILIFNIFFLFGNKIFYIFERSTYDVVIDPIRYRLAHKPIVFEAIYNTFFKNTKKIYINASYNLVTKRKGELTKKKYIKLKNKLDKFFNK